MRDANADHMHSLMNYYWKRDRSTVVVAGGIGEIEKINRTDADLAQPIKGPSR